MPKQKFSKEADLYEPLSAFLQTSKHCKFTWRVGVKPTIKFSVPGPFKRTADVVGAVREGKSWRTHVIEAKLLSKGNSLSEAISQLVSLSAWSDYLWLALPHSSWISCDKSSQEAYLDALREHSLGLLLIGLQSVEEKLSAKLCSVTQDDKRADILLHFRIETGQRIVAHSLSAGDVQAAVGASTAVFALLQEALSASSDVKPHYAADFGSIDADSAQTYFLISGFTCRDVYVDGDPFGCYLSDGCPAIWIWKPVEDLQRLLDKRRAVHEGWYLYGESKEGHEMRSLDDVSDAVDWSDLADLHLAKPIRVAGRTRSGFRSEFRRMLSTSLTIGPSGLL